MEIPYNGLAFSLLKFAHRTCGTLLRHKPSYSPYKIVSIITSICYHIEKKGDFLQILTAVHVSLSNH